MTEQLTPEIEREFMIAAHGNFERTKELLETYPDLMTINYKWGENNYETPIQAPAHVGHVPLTEYLLEQGAPLEICTAAMLGRTDVVKQILADDPEQIKAFGGHGIPLLNHASISGVIEIVELIRDGGGEMRAASSALFGAIGGGHLTMVQWLLDNGGDDLSVTDFQGLTPLDLAIRMGHDDIAILLREHGATESESNEEA